MKLTEKYFSGLTVQNVLKENLIDTTEENLSQIKYEPESVLGYVEVNKFYTNIEKFVIFLLDGMEWTR